jgi:hypothetical protein
VLEVCYVVLFGGYVNKACLVCVYCSYLPNNLLGVSLGVQDVISYLIGFYFSARLVVVSN